MAHLEDFLDTWRIHGQINRYLLAAIPDEALDAKPPKGRTARAQFVHIHNVRLMWLQASAPDLMAGLSKLESDAPRDLIAQSLTESDTAIREILSRGLADGRIKGFRPHAAAFFGYLISHESHHRGQIEINLRALGSPIPDKVSYGLWEWGSRGAEA